MSVRPSKNDWSAGDKQQSFDGKQKADGSLRLTNKIGGLFCNKIAVRVINHYGDEVLKVYDIDLKKNKERKKNGPLARRSCWQSKLW